MRRSPLWEPTFVPEDAWARGIIIRHFAEGDLGRVHRFEAEHGLLYPPKLARFLHYDSDAPTPKCVSDFKDFAYSHFPEELVWTDGVYVMREYPQAWETMPWAKGMNHLCGMLACYHEFDFDVIRNGPEVTAVRQSSRTSHALSED